MSQQENNIDKKLLYMDLPFYKKLDENKNLQKLYNSDAISTAFKNWISSAYRERVRSTTGGILYGLLGKGITDDNEKRLRQVILEGLSRDFSIAITVESLNIIQDHANNRWIIQLTGYNNILNVGINTLVAIRDGGF